MDVALITFDDVERAALAYADVCDRSGTRGGWRDRIGLVEHHADGHLVLRGTFADHYVDVDEAAHTSESGAAAGLRKGALTGFLLTPAGFAVASILGAAIGSQEGEPSERDPEPTLVTDKLREAVPAPGSAVVLVADPGVVDEMLSAFEREGGRVTRRTLTRDELAGLDVALSDTPSATASGGPRHG